MHHGRSRARLDPSELGTARSRGRLRRPPKQPVSLYWQAQHPGLILIGMVAWRSQWSRPCSAVVIRIAILLATITLTLVTAACTSSSPRRHATVESHRASPGSTSALARAGLALPATYQQACAGAASSGCLNVPAGPIPAVLNRPLHFPVLRPGQRCPASHGSSGPVTIAGDIGTEFGNGPVHVLIRASRHGVAGLLAHTNSPPWLGFKTLWFSVPAYQGPFVIRAVRLGHPGQVSLAGTPPAMAPIVVPPGPTIDTVPLGNGRPGYRKVQSVFWVRSPGCYAWQVDGLTFSEIIVIRALVH